MNLQRLKGLCEGREGGIKRLAVDLGMSEQNLHRNINLNDMKASKLEKVAQIFNVPVSYFFDDEPMSLSVVNGNGSASSVHGDATISVNTSDKDKEIEHLKALLEEKERTIQILLKNINS